MSLIDDRELKLADDLAGVRDIQRSISTDLIRMNGGKIAGGKDLQELDATYYILALALALPPNAIPVLYL